MLTKDQIDYLFKFCEKHLVFYYEVQVELVDHLANAVEKEMADDEKLTFESALDKVYARFGVMGFAPIVAEKLGLAQSKALKRYWRIVANQFAWPRVLMFLAVSALFYVLLGMNFDIGLAGLVILLFAGLALEIVEFVRFSRFLKRSQKKFLSAQYFSQFQTGWFLFYLLVQIPLQMDRFGVVVPYQAMMISGAAGLAVVLFVAGHHSVKAMKEQIIADFPEVFQLRLR